MRLLVITNAELKEELLSNRDNIPDDIIWINDMADLPASPSFDACIDLLFEPLAYRIDWLNSLSCDLFIVNAVTSLLDSLPQKFMRINGWPTFLKRNTVEASIRDLASRQAAETIFAIFGKNVQWVPDVKGFLTARVVASIINEAFFAWSEEVCTPGEIDIAMKLGTNYPYGPFEWAENIGLHRVYELLDQLSATDSRYLPADLLKKKVLSE